MPVTDKATVRDLMIEPVHTVQEMMPALQAAKRMTERGVRHLVVTGENGRPRGVLSQRDLLKHLSPWLSKVDGTNPPGQVADSVAVEELMSKRLVTVTADATLQEAAAILAKTKYGCLPVVDDRDYLIGMLSVIDLLRCQAACQEHNEEDFDFFEPPTLLSRRAFFEPNGDLVLPREALSDQAIDSRSTVVLGYSSKNHRVAVKLFDENHRGDGGRGARPIELQDERLIVQAEDFRRHYGLEEVRDFEVTKDAKTGNAILAPVLDQPAE